MPSKTTKSSTAAKPKGKGVTSLDDSSDEMEILPQKINTNGKEAARSKDATPDVTDEAVDNRSLEEILSSIPPPPPPAMTNEPGAPRLMITHIVNQNFKSYADEQVLGPFHKRFSCIIGPNGSGKSNVIDSMLFVFGYRAQKIRSKKLSVLIHNSDEHSNVQSCTVEVHFQKIIDKEGDDYEVIPNSKFYVSRTAYKDNSSVYNINGKKATFKDVGALLRSHGIDLDHNRFLILQGEVEQIAMMKPKGQTEHDEGMLEYLEDIIGSARLKEPIQILCRRVESLNEQRGEKLNRVKMVEKEKDALEGEKNCAIEFLTMENEIFKKRNHVCQYYIHDLQRRVTDMEAQKQTILDDTKDINEKSNNLAEQLKVKNKTLKDVEKKLGKITKFIEERKEKFTQLDLQDVEVREKLKHSKSKVKKLQKQLQKDKEKEEELKNVPANSEKTISEATAKKEEQEKQKAVEEEKLKKVMESLKLETQGLQQEKEVKEKELMELSKAVNATRSTMDVAQSEIDIYLSRHNTALTQLNNAKEALQTTTETLKERKTAIKELETKIPKCEEELQKDEQQLIKIVKADGEIREVVRGLRQKVEEAKSSLSSNRSRGKVLDALMQQKKSGKIPGILGRLGDLGAIDEKYDVAISSSCGSLDNILVDTIDTAQECVNFLKKQNVGVATFIGLDKMKVWENKMAKIQTPENIPRLFDMVKVQDKAVLPAFYFALRNTLVADHLEQATRLAFQKDKRWRVVTLQGQIIEQSGTMTGGGGRVMKGRMGSSLAQEVSQEELDTMESKLKKDVALAQTYQEGKGKLEEKVHTMRQTIREMKNTLEKYIASIKSLSEQEVHLKVQMKELQANVVAAAPDKNKQKQLEKTLETFKKEYESAAGKAGKVEAEVKRLHNLIIDINNHKLKAQQDKLDKINKEIDDCASAIIKAQVAIKTAGRNLKKSEDAVTRTEQEIVENDKAVEELTGELKKLEEEATIVMKECKEAEETLPEVQEEHRGVIQEIKAIQEEDHALQKESLNIRLKIEQIESHIAEHHSKIKHWQKEISRISLHAIDDKTAEELQTLTQEDLEATKDPGLLNNQIALLEAKCLEIKPNLGAIAEYKKKEELYLQRVAELDEITNERDNFRRAYEDLRKQRLNEFMAGFNVITNKLKENYQMLTLGGDAELELVDSLDPFSEGIMFSVRPPKKSWKKIFNLSGGEKTLSSLALVFALHHFKPTPLYFMDEIDAALDFKNVSIVAFYIYEQTKNAQFIIISLRNNMFEIADRLIGIYKTHNTTKSVGINPKIIASKELTEVPSE
ncbi:structural maintenance of chromosomes protein 4 [Acipenser oxyrinchus oxyrinchus]|uniref:Structural maintenance of chromosomes protein n=1 Tax=Acipenser oxyrinchus oxyrinchus TaxID=40147 RepID=A0AAD8DFT5_ACIOX|nr:structural maintenance of chromosomes protein 4 [Acipenser oxyrinchus oxyrinchus]